MWWQYLLVVFGAFFFDVVAFPFPPAFAIMVFVQITFGVNIWWVIVIGVAGSILGRYALTLYIPLLAGRFFKRSKNEDVQFLGNTMKEKGWRSQAVIIAYSLLPLPTTPLFVAERRDNRQSGNFRHTTAEVDRKFGGGAASSRRSVIY